MDRFRFQRWLIDESIISYEGFPIDMDNNQGHSINQQRNKTYMLFSKVIYSALTKAGLIISECHMSLHMS